MDSILNRFMHRSHKETEVKPHGSVSIFHAEIIFWETQICFEYKIRNKQLTIKHNSYSKTNQMHQFLKFIFFGTTLYMFRTVFPSIIRSSRLYIQHQVYGIQVSRLLASKQTSVSVLTYTWCCMYSLELLMMDRKTVRTCRVLCQNKINLRNWCI